MKTLITVAGRVSAGKSEIAKRVAKEMGLNIVQSYTTRKPRPEELKNGLKNSDHIFISDEEFDKLTDIAAKTEINGVRYCTTMDILDKSDIYVIDPQGIEDLKRTVGDKLHIVQFYIYTYEDIRCQRYVNRGESEDAFNARNAAEKGQFSDYENKHGYDIVIYNNGNIDDAVSLMKQYLEIILEDRNEDKAAKDTTESAKHDVQTECETPQTEENEKVSSEKTEAESQLRDATKPDEVGEAAKQKDTEYNTDDTKIDNSSEEAENPESLSNLGFSLDDDNKINDDASNIESDADGDADGDADDNTKAKEKSESNDSDTGNSEGHSDNSIYSEFSLDDDDDDEDAGAKSAQPENKSEDSKSENNEYNNSADNSSPDYTEAVLLD